MEIDSEILEAMEADVKVKRVDAIDAVTKDIKYSQEKTVHVGLGNTVFECVKKLANKTNIPLVSHLLRSKITPEYTLTEVATHHDATSCWIVVADKVYDVTEFVNEHPGGDEIILENAGTDATVPYESKGHSKYADDLLDNYCIGVLVKEDRRFQT